MFFIMKSRILERNVCPGVTLRPYHGLRDFGRRWRGDASDPYGGWFLDPRKLPRFSRVSSCPLDKARDREPWKRMRWWSHGAFGNKGRLEGGQYLAGRRAPPSLLNR